MINIQKFNEVVASAKAKASDSPRWIRAIDKAAKAILSGELIVTTLAHGALVTSANGTYAANGHCSCPAARWGNGNTVCYHRAAARLMDLYETEMAQAVSFTADVEASSRENIIAEIENIWPRVESTPLAVALMSRFGKNQLDMLDDDMLRRVRLAIAA
jgi:hypothetical protein